MDFEAVMVLEYETQHFGFHPRVFLDKVYNVFYESLFEALTELKKHLSTTYGQVVSMDVIHKSTDSLFQDLVKKLDKAIDKLEVYIDSNVFMIPNHAVLPEDEVHITEPCTKEEDEKLDKEIEQIKQRILEERIRRSILKSKIEEQKYVKEHLIAFKTKLEQLASIVHHSRGTQEDLKSTMEKCWNIWNTIKKPPSF